MSVYKKLRALELNPEVKSYREMIMNEERIVSLDQAVSITASYSEHEGEPIVLQRAYAFARSLRDIPIRIDPVERIAGNRTPGIRSGVVFPEAGLSWLEREFDILDSREQDRFSKNDEDRKILFDTLLPFWKGRTLEDYITAERGEEIKEIAKVVKINQKDHAQGHIAPDVKLWLEKGPAGLLEDVKAAAAAAAAAAGAAAGQSVKDFHRAQEIMLRGASDFMMRYSELASSLLQDSSYNKDYLEEIRDNCAAAAQRAPESYHEALQSLWFLFVLLQAESNASSFSPGRMDQYLYPYLKKDLDAGVIDLETSQELLEHLWLSFNKIVYLRNSDGARYFAGFPIGFNVAVGGLDSEGKDASNLLSWMCLKAQEHIGLPQPNLSVRLHKDSPDDFTDFCSYVIGQGSGMPQIFNDESIIPSLQNVGISREDAMNYAVVGCVELTTPGNNLGWSDAAMFNMVKALELTLNNGVCLQSGSQIGPSLGSLEDYESYEDLEEAFRGQLDYFMQQMIRSCDFVDRAHAEVVPSPFLSSVIDNCTEKGLDVTAGGAKYNLSGIQLIQVANVADSLMALKKLVFEEKSITAAEYLQALKDDWKGHEKLRQTVLRRIPKYGNDNSEVDAIGAVWVNYFADGLKPYTNARGGLYHTGLYTVSAHVPMGKNVGASPDGRFAGSPLADGGISAMYGRDEKGPTALLQSVSRIPSLRASNGTLLNMKFLPEFFQSPEDLRKFSSMLKTFVRLKIHHVQFNVVRKEDLLDAQKNPEAYKGLTIRVAGYTAYFTELARDLQDEIIARTGYGA
ncbi:MAG: formate C-acetyltransferase/glycerol dehydratase family glycyl radical enzyme [Spirochaetales bacterium]|nr:formate C-acetyltransferase/glycerol dehydratase family glycyl radical enzyme [Spirochaetales bacterium]